MSKIDPERIKMIVRSNFDDSVDLYARFEERFGLFRRLAADLALKCEVSPGMVVVDIGCGTGASTFALADVVGEDGTVIGIDLSERMLDAARKKHIETRWGGGKGARILFLQGDAEEVQDIVDGNVDAVLYNAAVFLIPNAPRSLEGVYVVLKPGGIVGMNFILGVFNAEVVEDRNVGLVRMEKWESTKKMGADFPGQITTDLFQQARDQNVEFAPYGRGINDVSALPGLLTKTGFRDVQQGVKDAKMTGDELSAFYKVPAQSAGLYPKTPYEERLLLLDALLDHFEDRGITHFIQRWGWCSAKRRDE